MHWINFKKIMFCQKAHKTSVRSILFLGNLKTLENFIFSDIFWKVKSTESIVFFSLSYFEEITKIFIVLSAQEKISLFYIFGHPIIS